MQFMADHTMSSGKSVIVVGDGYVARNTLSSLANRHGREVDIVAGVQDPFSFEPIDGVRAIKADLWDRSMLTETLRVGNYCRVFIVLPGHADRLQMGWNGLEAARAAGILQVVLVSVLTAETLASSEAYFKPLGDNVQRLGKVELLRTPSPILLTPEMADPSTCMRIQRSRVLEGWYPMKVKLVQISLPNLDPASRCGKAPRMYSKIQDNGLSQLQQAFLGPYQKKTAPQVATGARAPSRKAVPSSIQPPTLGPAFINDIQHELLYRKEQLMESNRNATAFCSLPSNPMHTLAGTTLPTMSYSTLPSMSSQVFDACPPPYLPYPNHPAPHNTNSYIYPDILRALQEQQQALQGPPPQWF